MLVRWIFIVSGENAMENRKKCIAFILTLVLCLSLAACGNGDSVDDSRNSTDDSWDDDPISDAAGDFADLAGTWYLDGDLSAARIEIEANGEWMLYECPEGGELSLSDYGYLERHSSIASQYYARSSLFDGVVYDMLVYDALSSLFDDEAFVWGSENDSYVRRADTAEDDPAAPLGYRSLEEMRVQEHEIISSDDEDNTVAEGYWYPNGDRNSLTYIKIQRDTLYWYEFDPELGDVQVGEPDGILFKIGSKRHLASGTVFTYTGAWDLNDCRICFEDDTTEYYWRDR